MRASQAKRVIAMALAASATLALAAVVLILGGIVIGTGTGADPAAAFSEIPVLPENFDELVSWQPDRTDLIRQVEPDTRTLLESTLVRGWQSIDTAQRTGSRELVATWFMPGIVDQVARSASPSSAASVQQHDHTIEVTFYSLDGSVLGANLTSDLERRILGGPSLRTEEHFEVVFLLSDGNWRIQQLNRLPQGFTRDE